MKTPKLLENDVKRQVKEILDLHHVWNFPLTQSLGSYKGLPDRMAVHKGICWAIECKRPGGRQSEHQKRFEAAWKGNYGDTYILADNPEIVIKRMGLGGKIS